jgi:hypothetical protein
MDLLAETEERQSFLPSVHIVRTVREKSSWKDAWSFRALAGVIVLVFGNAIFLKLWLAHLHNDRVCTTQLSSYCERGLPMAVLSLFI